MTEEKKEGSYSSSGCGCCKGTKALLGILIAVFIFASGMWFAQSRCHHCSMGSGNFCPFSHAPVTK